MCLSHKRNLFSTLVEQREFRATKSEPEEGRIVATKNSSQSKNATGANVGYETQLWQMADALRGSMDAAEYKHVVLGLIFLTNERMDRPRLRQPSGRGRT